MTAIRVGPPLPHNPWWWAMDFAWANLQRDNHRRWEAKAALLKTVGPEHYDFLDTARSRVAPAAQAGRVVEGVAV